mmetsp:Transcript_23169/g.65687  ORF Transcript_23169/g.65687 Transcript_23169/m.65687 type:complete len:298 (-) Transcript_23169:472-1365(-)
MLRGRLSSYIKHPPLPLRSSIRIGISSLGLPRLLGGCHLSTLVAPHHHVRLTLVLQRVLPHLGAADGNIHGLLQPHKDVLLHVWHNVLLADRLQLRLALLVGAHGEVGPAVVLDLVVQPAVHEVVEVRARVEVRRGCDGPQVERRRLGLAADVEAVQVIACMVRDNDDEAVDVREHIRKQEVGDSVQVEHRIHEREREGQDEEAEQEVRSDDAPDELGDREDALALAGQQVAEGQRRLRIEVLGQGLPLLAHLGNLHLLVGVGCIVGPLPQEHRDEWHCEPLIAFPSLSIALQEVWV